MSTPRAVPPAQPFPPISELDRILAGVEGDYWRLDEASTARDTKMQRLPYRRQATLSNRLRQVRAELERS